MIAYKIIINNERNSIFMELQIEMQIIEQNKDIAFCVLFWDLI